MQTASLFYSSPTFESMHHLGTSRDVLIVLVKNCIHSDFPGYQQFEKLSTLGIVLCD